MPGAHLLIVDDEDNLRSMLAAALRHHGFEVSAVGQRPRGARRGRRASPDLVVLDVMLPDLDGFEVCRRLRAGGDRTPVLFLTARDATEDKVRGLTLGGDDYLQKPFSLEELVARADGGAAADRSGPRRPDRAHVRRPERWTTTPTGSCAAASRSSLSPTEYNLLRYLLAQPGPGASPRRRSSTTSGSTTSAATAAWSRPTSATSGASSTHDEPRLITTDPGRRLHAARARRRRADAAMRRPVAPGPPARRDGRRSSSSSCVVALIVTATTRAYLVDQVDDRLAAAGRPGA